MSGLVLPHPRLAPLLHGGAAPSRWLAEVRRADDWVERFGGDAWVGLEALAAAPYAPLLQSPLGGEARVLEGALAQVQRAGDAEEATATEPRTPRLVDPVQSPPSERVSPPSAAGRSAVGGREPPSAPAAPQGPIGRAFAAARLGQRAAAAGLGAAWQQLLGPQALALTAALRGGIQPVDAWHQVVGLPPQAGAARAAQAGVPLASPPDSGSSLPDAARAGVMRLADAVDRVWQGAAARLEPAAQGHAGALQTALAGDAPSPADRRRPGRPDAPPATSAPPVSWASASSAPAGVGAARGPTSASGGPTRAATQAMTGLRGLAARAAAARLEDTAPARATAGGAGEEVTPAPPEPRPRTDVAAAAAALDDDRLVAQLARVLKREAERDGVDVDDVSP